MPPSHHGQYSSQASALFSLAAWRSKGCQLPATCYTCRENASKRPLGRYDLAAGVKRRSGTFTVWPRRFLRKHFGAFGPAMIPKGKGMLGKVYRYPGKY